MKSIDSQNHYEILEVGAEARPEELDRAYRIALAAFANGSLAAYSIFEDVDTDVIRERVELAYRVLSDPVQRRAYDESIGRSVPARDETVLPTAVVTVAGEATDDVAVEELGLEFTVKRAGETTETALPDAPRRDVDAATATIETTLELAGHELREGDIVLVTAVARGIYELDGERHELARSAVRRPP